MGLWITTETFLNKIHRFHFQNDAKTWGPNWTPNYLNLSKKKKNKNKNKNKNNKKKNTFSAILAFIMGIILDLKPMNDTVWLQM